MQKYKSPRLKFANYYENKLYVKRFQPMAMLQVGIENTIPVWNKYLERCNIYCIDTFDDKEPRSFKFLNEKKVFWSRCNVKEHKELEHVMKNIWNNPRFNFIIDNTNSYKSLRKYCIGDYYSEVKDEVFCHSC
tara:strand:+ start:1534 stop:1932 length:399 start_codon:yes stop_codon:yes gene_type:complete